jgi:hypothetical protein
MAAQTLNMATAFTDRARRARSAFWGPRSVKDVSVVDRPSTYYSREQPRDLSGTLARALRQRAADDWDAANRYKAAADVNLGVDISARTTSAAAADYRLAINDLAAQALRVLILW